MGRAARPIHDPGNHRAIERGSNLQAARRGGLMKPAKPAGERKNAAALTPSPGTPSGASYRARRGGATTRYLLSPTLDDIAFPVMRPELPGGSPLFRIGR